jgi:uncharacterized protein (TIGR04141 family)
VQARSCSSKRVDATKSRYHTYAHSSEDDNILHEWSVYHCLYAELQHDKAQYLLNSGKWCNVEKDFQRRIS